MTARRYTVRGYPNLPASQQLVQRLGDEFNAAERAWERKHPVKPKRKRSRKERKAGGTGAALKSHLRNRASSLSGHELPSSEAIIVKSIRNQAK